MSLVRLGAGLGLIALTPAGAAAAADPASYMPAQLIAETLVLRPGSTILVGFRMSPKPGWHGYWSNPGDSGLVPTVSWTAPRGMKFGPLLHPAPTLISDGGIDSYVHEGPHLLIARMTVPPSISRGTTIPVKAKLNWAACRATQCVPLSATFTLDLVTGDGGKGSHSAALQAAKRKLPASAPDGRFTKTGETVRLVLPPALKIDRRSARFFPDDNDSFETAKGRVAGVSGRTAIAAPSVGAVGDSISGVISDGRRSYRLAFRRGEDAAPVAGKERVEAESKQEAAIAAEPEIAAPTAQAAVPPPRPAKDRGLWLWGLVAAATLPAGAFAFYKLRRG